ncbi:hypothetical protein K1719_007745 [Acacia pycnantha]|nr:hypothetical protein K1719_007745 [Acacia pycnantha]
MSDLQAVFEVGVLDAIAGEKQVCQGYRLHNIFIFPSLSLSTETERYRLELAKVRAELEPWEKDLIEHKGKLEVACTESKLLNEKHQAARGAYEDAKNRCKKLVKNKKNASKNKMH